MDGILFFGKYVLKVEPKAEQNFKQCLDDV